MLSNAHAFPVDIAKKPANKKKNRYANIVTYDNSRVLISRQADDEHSDYINASYIKGYDGSTKKYIATQGPTPQTVADFWQMIWEVNSCTIVMLTNLKEGSKAKCHQYWPEDKETHRDITVIIQKSEVFPDYIIRTLLLTKSNTNESLEVNHFQFTVWPDHGVPQYSTAVLGLRRQVNALNPDHAGPLVVHCSAGVGRTGAYIVIDAMLERAKHLKNVAIPDYVASIRNDRPYMVQTEIISTSKLEDEIIEIEKQKEWEKDMCLLSNTFQINQN
ncbi:Receptor-type tyrosine-protein phosphatase F [Exaiptasia diaphana]|nr:Receptor-type tyrosine-protein phosphatase F [Exaiptasia diaphana]